VEPYDDQMQGRIAAVCFGTFAVNVSVEQPENAIADGAETTPVETQWIMVTVALI